MKISRMVKDLVKVYTHKSLAKKLGVHYNTITAWKLDPPIRHDRYLKLKKLHQENVQGINRVKTKRLVK